MYQVPNTGPQLLAYITQPSTNPNLLKMRSRLMMFNERNSTQIR